MRMFAPLLSLLLLLSCGDTQAVSVDADTAPAASVAAPPAPVTNNFPAPVTGDLESPRIEVTVTGAAPGATSLVGQYADQQFRAMNATADAQGRVVFERENPIDPGFYYAYYSDGTAAPMLISEDQTFSLVTAKASINESMQVEGSIDNELLYEGIAYEATLGPRFAAASGDLATTQQLARERKAHFEEIFAQHPATLYTSYKRAGQNPDFREGAATDEEKVLYYRKDFWNSVNFKDLRLLRTPVIATKLKRYIKDLTPQNADSIKSAADYLMAVSAGGDPEFFKYFANFITLAYEPGKSEVMDADAIHVHMVRNYFTRDRAFWADSMTVFGLQQRAGQMANSLVGQKGVNVSVPGVDGQPKALYDEDAPYVIVYMYNPDCDHCQKETPQLVNWHKKNKDKFDVYAIALDTEDAKWRNFIRDYGTEGFTNVYDPTNRSIYQTYYVDQTPELYVLGPDRKIIAKNLKVGQIDQALALLQ